MANDNKKINGSGPDQDDDPTAELEILSEAVCAEVDDNSGVVTKFGDRASEFTEPDTEVGDVDETISNLKSDLESRTETISALQFEIKQLRSRSTGLEKEVNVLEEILKNATEEVKSAYKKQSQTGTLLKKCDNEIESLRSELSGKEQTLKDYARQIEDTNNKERESVPIDLETNRSQVLEPRLQDRDTGNDGPHELALLVPIKGNGSSEHPIRTGRLSLGSSPDNDIQIKSEFISRHHAQIVSSTSDSILGDLNSTNGTYVNYKRIKRYALRNGDSISIGKLHFTFVKKKFGASDYQSGIDGIRIKP